MDSKKSKKTKATPKATSKLVVKKNDAAKASFGRRFFNKIKTSKRKIILTVAWIAAFLVALALVDYFVQYENNDASVAVVNGDRIYRSDYISRLERSYGTKMLNDLIDQKLAFNEAAKENITVTDQEIDAYIKKFYDDVIGSHDSFLAYLKSNLLSYDDIRLETKKTIIMIKKFPYTDSDLQTFFTQYKTNFQAGDSKTTYDQVKVNVEYQYILNVVTGDYYGGKWLSDLRAAASIQDNLDPTTKPSYGLFKQTISIINGLLKKK